MHAQEKRSHAPAWRYPKAYCHDQGLCILFYFTLPRCPNFKLRYLSLVSSNRRYTGTEWTKLKKSGELNLVYPPAMVCSIKTSPNCLSWTLINHCRLRGRTCDGSSRSYSLVRDAVRLIIGCYLVANREGLAVCHQLVVTTRLLITGVSGIDRTGT